MSGKEFFKNALMNFFIIVTLINVAVFVLGSIFKPDQQFGYEIFLMPLIYGVLGMIPVVIMYSKKELSVKELCIRKVFQLISICLIMYITVYGIDNIKNESILQTCLFGLSIVIIYTAANVITAIINANDARKLNDLLKKYQQ